MIKKITLLALSTTLLMAACDSVEIGEFEPAQPAETKEKNEAEATEDYNAEFIFIDVSHSAYVVFASVGKDTPADQKENVLGLAEANETMFTVDATEFYDKIELTMKETVIEDQYEFDLATNMEEFLENNIGVQIGITWNGGVAFTYGDYLDTIERYNSYKDDAEAYLEQELPAQDQDSTHPANHFGYL